MGRGTRQRFPGRHVISWKGRLSLRLISWLGPQIQWEATGNFSTARNGDGVGRLSGLMWGHPHWAPRNEMRWCSCVGTTWETRSVGSRRPSSGLTAGPFAPNTRWRSQLSCTNSAVRCVRLAAHFYKYLPALPMSCPHRVFPSLLQQRSSTRAPCRMLWLERLLVG